MIAFEKKYKGPSNYGRLVRYLADPQRHKQAPGRRDRVLQIRATNLHNNLVADREGLEDALAEVKQLQNRNHRADKKTLHLLLTFREELDFKTLAELEQRVVDAVGYGAHQRISVVHGDKPIKHLHIAVNKVYRTKDKQGREIFRNRHLEHGWPKLARIATILEREYGLLPDNKKEWKASNTPQPNAEEREDLVAELREGWTKEIQGARDWASVLTASTEHGITLKPMGRNGLRLVAEDGRAIPAGKLGKSFTRSALEHRLGPLPRDLVQPAATSTATLPLATRIRRGSGRDLQAASTWSELHGVAAQHGYRLLPRGAGLVFEDVHTGELTKASSVSNKLSLGRAEQRLGPYQPGQHAPIVQLREAVLSKATTQADQAREWRDAFIKRTTKDRQRRTQWLSESRRRRAEDDRTLQSLHGFGHRLEHTPVHAWPKLRAEAPSLLAVFRHYAVVVRRQIPGLAPATQHISQHLLESRFRNPSTLQTGTSLVRATQRRRLPGLPANKDVRSHAPLYGSAVERSPDTKDPDHGTQLPHRRQLSRVAPTGPKPLHQLPARNLVPTAEEPALPLHLAQSGKLHQRHAPEGGHRLRRPHDGDQLLRLDSAKGRHHRLGPRELDDLRRAPAEPPAARSHHLQQLSERSLVRPASGDPLRLPHVARGGLHERSPLGPYRGLRRGPDQRPAATKEATSLTPLPRHIRRQAGAQLRSAGSWRAVHQIAARHGLRLLCRGRSLVFEQLETGDFALASAVSNRLALGVAERRLGPFQAGAMPADIRAREAAVNAALAKALDEHQRRRAAILREHPQGHVRAAHLREAVQHYQEQKLVAETGRLATAPEPLLPPPSSRQHTRPQGQFLPRKPRTGRTGEPQAQSARPGSAAQDPRERTKQTDVQRAAQNTKSRGR